MLECLNSKQLAEWMAYAELEPFGSQQDDFRAGQISSTVANYAGRMRDEKAGIAQPADFMPALADPKRDDPVLLTDPVEQAKLIKRMIFKVQNNV